MKNVFPNVKPRRLGQRGQSRYCYGGLRKKLDIEMPSLPELEISSLKELDTKNEDDELVTASCHLVLEWASKLLGQNFSGVRELSEYLVSNLYVNSKSVAAFTVIAAMQESGMQSLKVPSLFNNTTGGDRHRETQLQLQRKLQERELLAKQKKKLQQQREENQLRLRQSHDRQTPLITSPTIQQVLRSPARRIFDEVRGSESTVTPSDSDILRSQSVTVFAPVSEVALEATLRSKSSASVHMNSDILVGKTNCKPQSESIDTRMPSAEREAKSCSADPTTQVYQYTSSSDLKDNCSEITRSRKDSDSAMEISQIICDQNLNLQGKQTRQFSVDAVENTNTGSSSVMEVSSPQRSVEAVEKKLPYHTIRKPSVVKHGGVWKVPDKDMDVLITESPLISVVSSSNVPISNNGSNSQQAVVMDSTHTELSTNKENKESSLQLIARQSGKDAMSLPPNTQEVKHTTSAVSARSAFVPFSQVCNRKDLPAEVSVNHSPSISQTINQQNCHSLENLTQHIENTKTLPMNEAKAYEQNSKIISHSMVTSNPSLSNCVKSSTHLCSVAQSDVLIAMSSSMIASCTTVSTTACDYNLSSLSVDTTSTVQPIPYPSVTSNSIPVSSVTSSNESLSIPSNVPTSPSTPKKTRSRFTPIRPKASPAKTVSSILKENKTVSSDPEKYDKSRPVAELLKEKRAREAQLYSNKPCSQGNAITTSVTTQIQQIIPQPLPISAFGNIQGGPLPVGEKGNFFIILNANPALTPGVSNQPLVTSPAVSTISTDSLISANRESKGTTVTTKLSRSRTNSSSEREFDSPMPQSVEALNSSDLSDCSASNDEKPSKLIKIMDNEHNVSSRPGSRGSIEREETPLSFLGRKRKFLNNDVGNSFIMRQNSKRVDSIDDGDEEMISSEPFENLSSQSGKKNFEKTRGSSDSSKMGLCVNQHCPNISDLENDALSDSSDDQPLFMDRPHSKAVSSQNQQSMAVGVTSLSLTHQKFLKEKMLLDQRMKVFNQKGAEIEVQQANQQQTKKNSTSVQLSTMKDNTWNSEGETEMETELPPDVADFITDAMTGIEKTRIRSADPEKDQIMESVVSVDLSMSPITVEKHLVRSNVADELQKIKKHLQDHEVTADNHCSNVLSNALHIISSQGATYQPRSHSVTFSEPDVPHQIAQKDIVRSQSVTFSAFNKINNKVPAKTLQKNNIQSTENDASIIPGSYLRTEQQVVKGEFASPQKPVRRQRTPSVERNVNQIPIKFTSPLNPAMVKRSHREMSVDRIVNQTPFSDPGYGSVGPSPVPSMSSLSGTGQCDSTYSSMTSSHISGRPDSAQSLTSDYIPPSPISLPSPRFCTSTPHPLRSPCPTPNQALLLSPGPTEGSGPTRFMPIQSTANKTINSVTLIKPVVTVASHSLSQDSGNAHDQIDLNIASHNKGGHQNILKPPPSYSTAIQQQQVHDHQRKKSGNTLSDNLKEGAFMLLSENKRNIESQDLTNTLSNSEVTMQFLEKQGQSAFPFSNYFAQLSNRTKNNDQSAMNESTVDGNQKSQSIKAILGHLKSPLSHTKNQINLVTSAVNQLRNFDDLPDVNYQGSQPNVEISGTMGDIGNLQVLPGNQAVNNQIIQEDFQMTDQVFHEDVEFSAKRILTFNDQYDLQTTLDDLKDVDSEYFQHDVFDVEASKRQ